MAEHKITTRPVTSAYIEGLAGIDWSVGRAERDAARAEREAGRTAYRGKGQGIQVVPDIAPFIEPIEGKVIGGNRQKREFMRHHGVIDTGDERVKENKPQRDAVGPDIKRAIEELESR